MTRGATYEKKTPKIMKAYGQIKSCFYDLQSFWYVEIERVQICCIFNLILLSTHKKVLREER